MVRTTRIPFNPAPPTSRATGKRKGKQEVSHAASAAAPAPVTVWIWKPVDKTKLPRPASLKPPRKIFGIEVGVGADWSHLNKRRRRARFGKVRRDVSAMKMAQLVRKQKTKASAAMARSAARKAAVVRAAESSASRGLQAKSTVQKHLKEAATQVSASVATTSATAP